MCPCALHSSASGDPRSSRLHSADLKPSLFKLRPRGKPVCTIPYTNTVDKLFNRTGRRDRPAWMIQPLQDHHMVTGWLDGCPLGEKIIIRSSVLSSHAKMRHQHLTQ